MDSGNVFELFSQAVNEGDIVQLDKILNYFKTKNTNNEIFEQFEERTKQIRSSLNKKTIDHIKNVYNKKLFCLAKLKSENEYFRAEIKDFKDETNEIRVFYVDFGDYSWVNLDEIYPLNEKFLRILPFQAIECSLGNFSFFSELYTVKLLNLM